MRKKSRNYKFNSTIEKVFSKYGHEHEAPDQEVNKEVGRKQRRREAKLRKKNKMSQNVKTAQHIDKIRECESVPKKSKINDKKRKVESSSDVRNKALRLENAREDKVIGALEKKLFLNKSKKKKKLPKSFLDSGLDYILDVVDGDFDHDSDDQDEFFMKTPQPDIARHKSVDEQLQGDVALPSNSDESLDDEDCIDDISSDDMEDVMENSRNDNAIDEKFEVEVGKSNCDSGKYIPPAKRVQLSDEQERNMEKLGRKLKGLLNRLSESNLKSICDDIENLYLNNSRAILHKVLASALMNQFDTPDPSPESMLVENAMLIAALSIRVGIEVLMHIYEVIALKLESLVKKKDEKDGKAPNNLIQLLCFLYQFKVIDCKVILDLFRLLIESFAEKDIELILEILNKVGFQMRKEDPESLKNMIKDIGAKCCDLEVGTDDGSRMSYMLSVLTAIKNNNIRKVTCYDPDEVVQRRKRLACLTKIAASNNNESMPPIALQDFLDISKNGRWWVVGSSFSGRPMLKDGYSKDRDERDILPASDFSVSRKIIEAAKAQRMNTDIRRKIFYAVMGADDYVDAFEKIMKCCLKGKQLREIANVVVDCCQKGKTYNPYYMHLLNRFCQYDRQFSISIQCTLWDRFKGIGTMKMSQQRNLATLMSQLISKGGLSVNCLKTVEFTEIEKDTINFLRLFLCKLAEEVDDENHLSQIFEHLKSSKTKVVRQGLHLFLEYFIEKDEKFMSEHSHLHTAFQIMATSLGKAASTFL